MWLLEWLGERRNPGPVGTFETGEPEPARGHPGTIFLKAALALIGAIAVGLPIAETAQTPKDRIWLALATILYFAVAYWVTPRPDRSNMGLASGLFDHPFRLSDDTNRILAILAILLWPGKFVTVSLRDLVRYLRGNRYIVLPPRR